MVVQHNLRAMNSNRMLGVTTSTQAKSTEKLSSGYKINRAADDAAGLSISEKMRKQVRGLTQASANAQDGISAVQTAEGALTEVHDMLQRMNELAVKAANGTNSVDDREYIQNEIDQLTTEIDRVAETTKFNETYLLKGDKSVAAEKTAKYKAPTVVNELKDADGVAVTVDDLQAKIDAGVKLYTTAPTPDSVTGTGGLANKVTIKDGATLPTADTTYTYSSGAWDSDPTSLFDLTATPANGDTIVFKKATAGTEATAGTDYTVSSPLYDANGNKISANGLDSYLNIKEDGTVELKPNKALYTDANGANHATATDLTANIETGDKRAALNLSLHVGADATSNNQITIKIDTMSASGLGVDNLKVDGKDDSNALNAIETIKAAIQKVSTQRSALGAAQNRLEHTIKNLDNVVENTTAAESQIRDTDMASEMVKYSNNNILAQAGQSMLAQSNQANQGVLSLLQ